jgi:hypothetical protein
MKARSLLALCLVLVGGVLAIASGASATRAAALVDECKTAVDPNSPTVDCLNPCAAPGSCVTRVPIPYPGAHGGTYTYCYCTTNGPAEPRCCHAIRIWLADGSYFALSKGPCGGDSCPSGLTCALLPDEATGYFYGLCVPY